MKLTLHIGHYKTGSTAVQDHFARNRAAYRRRGLLYPKTGKVIRSRRCHSVIAFQELHAADRKVANWYAATDEFKAFASGKRGRLLDKMQREIADKDPEHVLVSTEEFIRFGGRRGVPQDAAADLLEALGAESVHVVCYLRRPDRYLEAWYNQLIKAGRSPKRLARNLDRFIPTVHVQFADAVSYWANLPRVRDVTLRRYEHAAHDLIADFTTAIAAPELGEAAKRQGDTDVNPRLPDQFVEFARRANKAGGRRGDRNTILTELAAEPDIGSVPIDFLGQAARQRLLRVFRPIDKRLASLAGTGSAFFDDLDEIVDVDPAAISDREAFQRWRGIAEAATRDKLAPPRQPKGVGEAAASAPPRFGS